MPSIHQDDVAHSARQFAVTIVSVLKSLLAFDHYVVRGCKHCRHGTLTLSATDPEQNVDEVGSEERGKGDVEQLGQNDGSGSCDQHVQEWCVYACVCVCIRVC